jgi:predicted protein tyrosine phosphatase
MIRIHVYPEMAMVGQDFSDYLVISIVSPGREHPIGMISSNIHKFQFNDVTEEYFLENQNRIVRPMEKEIAESIAEIAMNNRDCDRWVIHCEAGISRSPGVAIGLASYIATIPDRKKLIELFPCYNKHVCRLIEDAMEVQMKELTTGLHIQKLLMEGR